MERIKIIGAGLAGLSAAVRLAEMGIHSTLISIQPSERAQSVMAEGGINAALNTMGEDDSPALHAADTLSAGVDLADPAAVKDLTSHAPEILSWLVNLGAPLSRREGRIIQRNFGGQKKKRTAFAQSSTGKVLMTALIDECRKYEELIDSMNGLHLSSMGEHLTAISVANGVEVRDNLKVLVDRDGAIRGESDT